MSELSALPAQELIEVTLTVDHASRGLRNRDIAGMRELTSSTTS
ncbi:hypothetical protein ACF09C_33565 [Streptomyces sp. NPDC014870]